MENTLPLPDLDTTPIRQPEPEPEEEAESSRMLIDIKFHNRRTYLAFQEEFITVIKSYYKTKLDDMDIMDDLGNNRIRVSEKRVKKSDGFLVDSTPNFKNLKSLDDEATPTYRNSFGKSVLTGEIPDVRKSTTSTPKNACFNCDKETHSLRDCPEPRNMKKVNKARNEYGRRDLRYHDDNENEYGQMVPGVISNELRDALGLNAAQLPLHIYRMRLLGYPPAWIEEAKIHNSGLSLFVDKDKKQLQPGEDDGEMDNNNFKYDIQKFFDFPGFNVKPNHSFVDMHRTYNTPPMMPQHSKELLIQSLGEDVVNGYKKTKRRHSGTIIDISGNGDCETEVTTLTVADMDVEDDCNEEVMPLGVTVCNLPPLPTESDKPAEPMEDGELSNDSRSASPNENELKDQRKAILAEIAESSVFFDTSTINSSANISAANTSAASLNQSQLDATIIENSENENRDNCAKDTATVTTENVNGATIEVAHEERTGHVDTTIFGCPVLPSFSPFNNLPSGNNFQVGVSDVIAFENLAESTGKYEKLKVLIKKVRSFQHDHQKE